MNYAKVTSANVMLPPGLLGVVRRRRGNKQTASWLYTLLFYLNINYPQLSLNVYKLTEKK